MKKFYTSFLYLLTVFFVTYITASAISGTITLDPKNPEPKSTVKLTLESYSFDVDSAVITWKVNGVVTRKGRGEDSLQIKTGDVGTSNEVTVLAETDNGEELEQKITITPSSIILLYEAPKSYVPLLYEGRSLPSTGASVKVTALPVLSDEGTPVPPSSIAYAWYIDDTILKSSSGSGKQSLTTRLDYLKEVTSIRVVARSPKGNIATKTIEIRPHDIMPLIYTYDPILGPNFTTLLEKRFEAVKDFTLSLEPFYVSDKETRSPAFTWYLDGSPSTPLGGKILGMSPQPNSYGTKMLSIVVEGFDRRLQKAETKLELIFDTRK
jgi:hypothetical protein